MGSGIYSIGVSGLQGAQLGLATTSHNIANANTDGYSRQRILQASNIGVATGAGYVGQGMHVTTIERVYSSHMTAQINSAQAKVSSLEAYSTELTYLNNVLSDTDAGLAPAINTFFEGINQVSSDPSSLTTRQTLVSSAQAMTSRFQSLNTLVEDQYKSINSQIQGYVTSVNSYSEQIATLNKQIIVAESANSQPPNDLYDQRDQLVNELNELVGAKVVTNTDGSYNVYFGNGQPLVTGTQVTRLTTMNSSQDPTRVVVGIETGSNDIELPESVITGGSLSGVLEYRSEVLDDVSNRLGQLAVSMALTFNAQHDLGQDLLGNAGSDVADFFTIGEATAFSSDPTAPDLDIQYQVEQAEDGTFYTNLTASDYRLQYDGTEFSLTRLSDNTQWSGADLTALNTALENDPQGFTISTTGTIAAGTSYLIQPTRGAASDIGVNATIVADVRQIAAAAPIRTSATSTNTGNATISAGSVSPGYIAKVELTYDSAGTSLSGFPAFPVEVTTGGVTTQYAGPDVPYVDGATYATGGISFVVSGGASPADGTTFEIEDSPVTVAYDSASKSLSGFDSFPVTVTVDGVKTDYDSTDTIPYTSGATYTSGGVSFTLSGAPADGDSFVIEPNTGGVSDNRNILLLGGMQTGKTMSGNSASYSTVYSQLVSNAGNKGGEVETILDAQTTLLTEAQDTRDSLSAVNLDEEAANLLKYQQAYQASAKMLQIASEMFDAVLNIR
ncbi:flagellar hook-associated protein FlgK [Propionivibrio limicola]|uniref:flagellar hook-associated protein FlgK n=1 Tax=Propionivibrio limicola TaxID=167645 RepID=UPI00129135B8|nr:flagellar hook-associated protein FlgK [Propionivibrio limicola]